MDVHMAAFGDNILVPVAGSLALVVGFCVGDIVFGSGLVADGGAIHAIVSCHGSTSFLFFTLAQKKKAMRCLLAM